MESSEFSPLVGFGQDFGAASAWELALRFGFSFGLGSHGRQPESSKRDCPGSLSSSGLSVAVGAAGDRL